MAVVVTIAKGYDRDPALLSPTIANRRSTIMHRVLKRYTLQDARSPGGLDELARERRLGKAEGCQSTLPGSVPGCALPAAALRIASAAYLPAVTSSVARMPASGLGE